MSDISDLSSFDDTMSDPDYGNPNSPIEVSDFLAPARTRKNLHPRDTLEGPIYADFFTGAACTQGRRQGWAFTPSRANLNLKYNNE
jgi:hypothetical protein